jgi:hypothetical protein
MLVVNFLAPGGAFTGDLRTSGGPPVPGGIVYDAAISRTAKPPAGMTVWCGI